MRKVVAWLGVGMLLTGCAGTKSKPAAATDEPSSPQKIIVTAATTATGTIVRVNDALRFVVVNFPVATMPPLRTKLNVYRHGLKVGEVEITGPQENDNTIADIVSGEARVGDGLRTD